MADQRQFGYFQNGWLGSHSFKVGAEYYLEINTAKTTPFDNLLMTLNNGVPVQVTLYLPATKNDARLRAVGAFLEDTWKISSRLTLDLGVRYDQYLSFTPKQLAPTGQTFDRINGPLWNNVAPRIGAVYSLTGDGKTVAKASFGQYWQDPYTALAALYNPNAGTSSTYPWTSTNPTIVNGLPVFQPGQQGRLLSTTGVNANGTQSVTVAPNLKNTYLLQATAYVEREIRPDFGIRTGLCGTLGARATGIQCKCSI